MVSINFSIIIPHYNIPELLIRCLNSIPIRQDIQVIVVDDCSPGADSYSEKYPEFKRSYLEWYSTPKGGSAGRARNIGLDHAKGKWVICLDADDLLVDNVGEILEESLNREEDILFYNYISVYSDDIKKKANRDTYHHLFSQYATNHDEIPFRFFFEAIWGKIIRKRLIDTHQIRCDETKYGNDVGFSVRIGYYANKIAIIDKPLFIITQRSGSLASSFFNGEEKKTEEMKIRTEVTMKSQNFVFSKGLKIETPSFKKHKTELLEKNGLFSFWILMTMMAFKYPNACKRIIKYWGNWKIKAIKKYLKMP